MAGCRYTIDDFSKWPEIKMPPFVEVACDSISKVFVGPMDGKDVAVRGMYFPNNEFPDAFGRGPVRPVSFFVETCIESRVDGKYLLVHRHHDRGLGHHCGHGTYVCVRDVTPRAANCPPNYGGYQNRRGSRSGRGIHDNRILRGFRGNTALGLLADLVSLRRADGVCHSSSHTSRVH